MEGDQENHIEMENSTTMFDECVKEVVLYLIFCNDIVCCGYV